MSESNQAITVDELDFKKWWDEVGSGITPMSGDDMESHAHGVARDAWVAARKNRFELGVDFWRAAAKGAVRYLVSIYNDFTEEEIKKQPKSIQDAWWIGKTSSRIHSNNQINKQ